MRNRKPWHAARAVICVTWALSPLSGFAPDRADRWLNATASMPPELGADVLIRAAGALVVDADRARLLAKAFVLASRAQELYGRVSRAPQLRESRARYVALSTKMGVNRLALQCRVIRAILPIDPSTARQLLEQLEMPALPPVACGDPLIPDISEYYDTARLVLAKSGLGDGRTAFLNRLIENIQSPLQLAPVARLLAQSELSGAELKRLVDNYAYALREMRGGDPAFRYAVVSQHLVTEVEALARRCQPDSDLTGALLLALRGFVTSHLSGPACHDSFLPEARREIQAAVVEPYNNRLRLPGELTRDGLPVLEMDEMWPSDADNARLEVQAFWQDNEAQALWSQVAERAADGGDSAEPKLDPAEVAHQVGVWQRPEAMAEEDFFHQKLLLYERLVGTLPAGASRQEVVRMCIAFLGDSPVQGRAPAEWLWHVAALMRDDGVREDVLRAMGESGDVALRSYAELEQRIPLSVSKSAVR